MVKRNRTGAYEKNGSYWIVGTAIKENGENVRPYNVKAQFDNLKAFNRAKWDLGKWDIAKCLKHDTSEGVLFEVMETTTSEEMGIITKEALMLSILKEKPLRYKEFHYRYVMKFRSKFHKTIDIRTSQRHVKELVEQGRIHRVKGYFQLSQKTSSPDSG